MAAGATKALSSVKDTVAAMYNEAKVVVVMDNIAGQGEVEQGSL